MKSRTHLTLPGSATRRIATVTISAPDSSIAWRMTSFVEYFPVPTIKRELNSFPPSTRFVSYMPSSDRFRSSPAHRSDDLDLVAVTQLRRRVLALGRDLAVHRHR